MWLVWGLWLPQAPPGPPLTHLWSICSTLNNWEALVQNPKHVLWIQNNRCLVLEIFFHTYTINRKHKIFHGNFFHTYNINRKYKIALAGVAQWIEYQPACKPKGCRLGAHAWVVGQVLSRGRVRSNHTLMFLSLSFSLCFPQSPLSKNK